MTPKSHRRYSQRETSEQVPGKAIGLQIKQWVRYYGQMVPEPFFAFNEILTNKTTFVCSLKHGNMFCHVNRHLMINIMPKLVLCGDENTLLRKRRLLSRDSFMIGMIVF